MVCSILVHVVVVADVGAAKQKQSEVWLLSPVLGICRLYSILYVEESHGNCRCVAILDSLHLLLDSLFFCCSCTYVSALFSYSYRADCVSKKKKTIVSAPLRRFGALTQEMLLENGQVPRRRCRHGNVTAYIDLQYYCLPTDRRFF